MTHRARQARRSGVVPSRGARLVLLLLVAPAMAMAETWADYVAAFPPFPCADGWSGCVVDGERVGSGSARPLADLRLDWFTLEPTPAFSPFVGLSDYTGESQSSAAPIPDVVKTPATAAPAPARPEPEPEPVAVADPKPSPRPTTPPSRVVPAPEPAPDGCSDLVALEANAMVGTLEPSERECLAGRARSDARQTSRKHASMLLIADAWGAGERDRWESLVLEHLEEIDRSDPALCYKLALHLQEQGPPRAAEVIRWSELAMQNARSRWSGEEFTDKMYSLHRLRTKAAMERWLVTDEQAKREPSSEVSQAAERYRGQAKNFAKEWYLYARKADKDATDPREMCRSAAGTADFCEGA